MTLSFNAIPAEFRTPGVFIEFDPSRAVQGLSAIQHKILVMGQRLAAGSVAEAIQKQILGGVQSEGFFGRGSQLANMCVALKKANPITEVWAIALDDNGAGAAATGSISITGTATENGTLNLYIQGVHVPVAVTSGDVNTVIAASLIAAINANTALELTALVDGVDAFKANLTARHKGEAGNDLDIRLNYQVSEKTPAGVSAVTIVAMSGGTTNPVVSTIITAIGDEQYNTIINPWTDASNMTLIEAELLSRWGPMLQNEGHVFSGFSGTHAEITTFGNSRNSQFITTIGMQNSPTPPWIMAAVSGAVDANEPDPARPRQTLSLRGIQPPEKVDRFTRAERDLHLHDGVSTFTIDNGGVVRIERLITMYQTNAQSIADTSYLDVTTMRTLAFLRFSLRTRIGLRYPRKKLAKNGANTSDPSVVTPNDVRDEVIALFTEWEEVGLVEGLDQFQDQLIVQINATDPNRIDLLMSPDLVNQFRGFAGQIQFLL